MHVLQSGVSIIYFCSDDTKLEKAKVINPVIQKCSMWIFCSKKRREKKYLVTFSFIEILSMRLGRCQREITWKWINKALLVYNSWPDSLRRNILLKILSEHLWLRKIDGSVDFLLSPFVAKVNYWCRGLFLKIPETFRAYFGCHNSLYMFATPRS